MFLISFLRTNKSNRLNFFLIILLNDTFCQKEFSASCCRRREVFLHSVVSKEHIFNMLNECVTRGCKVVTLVKLRRKRAQ